jgi:hypothetical protein
VNHKYTQPIPGTSKEIAIALHEGGFLGAESEGFKGKVGTAWGLKSYYYAL